jgi:hypothetical protein
MFLANLTIIGWESGVDGFEVNQQELRNPWCGLQVL